MFTTGPLINISGESGIGKTSLVQFVIGNLITRFKPYEDSCIWFQASENFSKSRLAQMFRKDLNKNRYLAHNFFLIPQLHCDSLDMQKQVVSNICRKGAILPVGLKFIVVDNISHHLRYKASKLKDISQRSLLLNHFYEEQLLPLYFFCSSQNVILILIHENTYDPGTNSQHPYFFKLYEKLDSISIRMRKDFETSKKEILVMKASQKWKISYEIEGSGFVFKK